MRTRLFLRYNAPGIACMLAILFLCLTPTQVHISDLGFFEFDKLVHFVSYAGLTLLNRWGLQRFFTAAGSGHSSLLWACVVSLFWGMLIEFLQEALPTGRFFEWYDMLANMLGILCAAVVAVVIPQPR